MSNEDLSEELANHLMDDIVGNLNLLKSFSIEIDKRLSNMENLVKEMVEPLNDLKKLILD